MALDTKKTLALAEKLCKVFPELNGKTAEVNKAICKHIRSGVRPIDRRIAELASCQSRDEGDPSVAIEFLNALIEKNHTQLCLGEDH